MNDTGEVMTSDEKSFRSAAPGGFGRASLPRCSTHNGWMDTPQPAFELGMAADRFGLSPRDVATLIGIKSGSETDQWGSDMPSKHHRKARLVLQILDVLTRQFEASALPAIVRRPAEAYGGRSMLSVIADDDHEWLLDTLRTQFDYSANT